MRWRDDVLSDYSGPPLRATGPWRSHLGVLPAVADPLGRGRPKPAEKRPKGHRTLRSCSLHRADEKQNHVEAVPLETQPNRRAVGTRGGAERAAICSRKMRWPMIPSPERCGC